MATQHVCDVCGKIIKKYDKVKDCVSVPKLYTLVSSGTGEAQGIKAVKSLYNNVDLCEGCLKNLREFLGLAIEVRLES